MARTVPAHEVTEGMFIIPADRTMPVEILGSWEARSDANCIEMGGLNRNGTVALRLRKDELVEVVSQ